MKCGETIAHILQHDIRSSSDGVERSNDQRRSRADDDRAVKAKILRSLLSPPPRLDSTHIALQVQRHANSSRVIMDDHSGAISILLKSAETSSKVKLRSQGVLFRDADTVGSL